MLSLLFPVLPDSMCNLLKFKFKYCHYHQAFCVHYEFKPYGYQCNFISTRPFFHLLMISSLVLNNLFSGTESYFSLLLILNPYFHSPISLPSSLFPSFYRNYVWFGIWVLWCMYANRNNFRCRINSSDKV